MSYEFVNWSESLRFTASDRVEPATEDDVVELVRKLAADGRTVRPVRAGPSSSRWSAPGSCCCRRTG